MTCKSVAINHFLAVATNKNRFPDVGLFAFRLKSEPEKAIYGNSKGQLGIQPNSISVRFYLPFPTQRCTRAYKS